MRESRKKQNLLQIDLAVIVGIDRAYLSEIENGRTNVSINLLYAIADALKENIADILPN
ncbi:MAG: helix-turn-helix transcriptional regulator [Alphaproteobacteria bacterium]|nr:helix-turn-helix transcriptional regulator [Alphaproteobacteria bacterium]